MSDEAKILERVKAALENVLGQPVEAVARSDWDARLLPGGEPTRLAEPFEPYRGVQDIPDYRAAVASAAPYAPVGGIHIVRFDKKDAPNVINTDLYVEFQDTDPRWPEVLRVSGLQDEDVRATRRAYVFTYAQNREDHHSTTIPEDIAGAKPKGPS
jgi:hypothetical protein